MFKSICDGRNSLPQKAPPAALAWSDAVRMCEAADTKPQQRGHGQLWRGQASCGKAGGFPGSQACWSSRSQSPGGGPWASVSPGTFTAMEMLRPQPDRPSQSEALMRGSTACVLTSPHGD